MSILRSLFLAFVAAASAVSVLTPDTLQDRVLTLPKGEGLFVNFFSASCGHCTKMAPAWEELAEANSGPKNTIAAMDLSQSENRIVAQLFNIRSFPQIKLFRDGRLFEYMGSRTFEGMNMWLNDELYLEGHHWELAVEINENSFVLTTTTTSTVPVKNEIITLTDADFEHLTQAASGATTGDWLVKFYTPWCGHCKRLAPEWQKLANSLDPVSSNLNIAKVDLQANPDLQTRFRIRSYPTIIYFTRGQFYEFKGSRSVEGLTNWIKTEKFKSAEKQGVVPAPLTMLGRVTTHLSDLTSDLMHVYKTFISPESIRVLYHNQPLLMISATVLIGLTGSLIVYQLTYIIVGIVTGDYRDDEGDDEKKNQ